MSGETNYPWRDWWTSRPWRPETRSVPKDLSSEERLEWVTDRQHKYYAAHRSAKAARWTIIVGLIVVVIGFFTSFSYSSAVDDLGNGLMIVGVVVAAFAAYFFSATARG
jgi:hypothetical protein